MECRGSSRLLPIASCREFGETVAFPLDDLGLCRSFNDLAESESSSLADLDQLDKSEFIHYYEQEKRSTKPWTKDDGGNVRRCRKYRLTRKNIEQQEKHEWQTLKDRNDKLRKLREDLTLSLEMTREPYLKCILSGKMMFSSG